MSGNATENDNPRLPAVLIVDDLESSVIVIKKILEPLSLEVYSASGPAEALERLRDRDYALLLMDVVMPEMNGYELAERINAADDLHHPPLIFLTVQKPGPDEVLRGYNAGAVDFLWKPFSPEVLRGKVRVFAEIKRQEMVIRGQADQIRRQKERLEKEIFERRRVEEAQAESEVRYRTLIELAPDAMVVQVNQGLRYFNAATMQLLAAREPELLDGRPLHEFADPEEHDAFKHYLHEVERQGGRAEPMETRLRRLDGQTVDVEARAGCILFEGQIGVQVALQDITVRKQLEDELRRLSQQDGLTRLANRRAFDQRLDEEWRRCHRQGLPLSLVMADIDSFKPYNDNYGHLAGDDCLKTVANALQDAVHRPGDLVARYGGEEFTVILPDTKIGGAEHVAEALRRHVEQMRIPHAHSDASDYVTISVGAAYCLPTLERNPTELVTLADEALYRAKQGGGNRTECMEEAAAEEPC